MYDPVLLGPTLAVRLHWGWDYNFTSDAGSYADIQPMYSSVLLGGLTLGVRL